MGETPSIPGGNCTMIVLWAAAAAGGLFVGAYVFFAWKEGIKTWVAAVAGLSGMGVGILAGLLPLSSGGFCDVFGYRPAESPWGFCAHNGFVEWDTLGLLLGLFMLATLLNDRGVFRYLALRLAKGSGGHPLRLFLALSGLAFVLSAFINSITVMLVLATITIEVAQDLGLSPIPLLLVEISASNAGGAATFVGDPPNVILGTYFGLSFNDFVLYAAPMALAALATLLLLFWWVSHRALERPRTPTPSSGSWQLPVLEPRGTLFATGAFALTIGLLVINSYIPPSVGEIGLIGGGLALVGAGRSGWRSLLRRVDWNTLGFFFFLFLLIGSLEVTGVIDVLARGVGRLGGTDLLLTSSLLLWILGLLSSVVDNVPLAAAAAPLIASLHAARGYPIGSLVYASAVGTDVGGNGTPIGASANVVGLAVARRAGVVISWKRYLSWAFPIMLASLGAANLVLLWVR